ncbi:LysM peptidoglycan-binding domain-containing protein [Sinomonas gamaensis]|uniref:LysM peptidoglycan-binding domain-containing protein n=1 Tax=Sinomonas gamaensis TaxID=2565624 RepID=UPI001108C4A6|nr:LysM peptidoglycan-binding domain-containing protein [Sinomonas gamaensis]
MNKHELSADGLLAVLVLVLAAGLAGIGSLLPSGPHQGIDALLGLCASTAGVGLAAWWLGSTCLAIVSALLAAAGSYRWARWTGALAPAFMRRLALGVLGLSLVAAPSAYAVSEPLDPAWRVSAVETTAAATENPVPSQNENEATPQKRDEQPLPVVGEHPEIVAEPLQEQAKPAQAAAPETILPRSAETALPEAWTPQPEQSPSGPLTRPVTRDSVTPPSMVEVRPGDSLWSVAARYLGPGASARDIAEAWPDWFEANRSVIGDNPDVIRPGQLLVAPHR